MGSWAHGFNLAVETTNDTEERDCLNYDPKVWLAGRCYLCRAEYRVADTSALYRACPVNGWCPRCITIVSEVQRGRRPADVREYRAWKYQCRTCFCEVVQYQAPSLAHKAMCFPCYDAAEALRAKRMKPNSAE